MKTTKNLHATSVLCVIYENAFQKIFIAITVVVVVVVVTVVVVVVAAVVVVAWLV